MTDAKPGKLHRRQLRVVKGGRQRPDLKVVVLGEEGNPLVEQLVGRLHNVPIEVIQLAGDEERVDINALAAQARGASAGFDLCVVQPELKAWAMDTLDKILSPEAPVFTCCHAASATGSAAMIAHPERVTGFALLPPWEERKTVECARALQTADAIIPAVEALWRLLGLDPVWVGDSVGLVMPRILACLINEALFATMERVARGSDIDRAMELGTRYPRGPLAWGNLIGLDQVLVTLDALAMEHGEDRYRAAPLLRRLVAAGWTHEVVW